MSKTNNTTKTVTITGFFACDGVEMYERFEAAPCVQTIQERGDYVVAAYGNNTALVNGMSHRALNAGIRAGDRVNLCKFGDDWVVVSKAN